MAVRRSRFRSIAAIALCVLLIVAATVVGVGYQLFNREHQDELRPADAIVVLGGEHDGREDYGLRLAHEGFAKTVAISDPYRPYPLLDKQIMDRVCNAGTPDIEVICFAPDPSTKQGEAMFIQHLAKERGWRSVIVISWRYHMVRARYIFGQCFDGQVIMRSVPRDYSRSVVKWAYQYAYQYGGLAKAAVLGCDR
ncbi:YdcF family protein [Gordonia sp. SL306]|uniref:YdcF family protein n=1 Tax=Gordonia sp. SL306 TaxID=2995145 RepID=UPI0022707875|nr:YdcF family protein [Gordonia sp. SL306]WAC56777.1 YdcF family protein [Gordonia sp. SL306]